MDIGSGLPTVCNVHEIARRTNAYARVVYVDIDTVAVAPGQNMLRGQSNVVAILGICASLTRPCGIPKFAKCWI